ncbi:VanW family protein [Candidatus Uhrbacteria bacterium]|nr:VanW family protein [Candidatus Uhrbacteria bacterium]
MRTSLKTSFFSRQSHNPFFTICAFFVLLIVLVAGVSIAYGEFYAHTEKIFFGVHAGGVDAGGLTKQELAEKLESVIDTIRRQGMEVTYEDIFHVRKRAFMPLENTSLQSDIPIQALGEIFFFDAQKTAELAYDQGRTGTFFQKYRDRLFLFFAGHGISLDVSLNEKFFIQSLKKELISFESPARDASFAFHARTASISIEPEQSGRELDSTQALNDVLEFLQKGERPRITLVSNIKLASLFANHLLDFKNRAQQIIERSPIILSLDKKTWEVSRESLASWFTIEKNASDRPILSLNKDAVVSYLEEHITSDVRVQAKIARFEMKDGKVTAFDQQENGRELDAEQSASAIISGIFEKNETAIPLITRETVPPLTTDESTPLVHDILASAGTDFKGSPKNRIFNITLGASRIHGILIESGKEFSLISFLGKIDEVSGFLPELVIKGTKTTPEFGGGLCQVSTTLFRTVAAAGLPILERKNHSYRVPYYEPPIGFDATVYYPKPDFRFLNDTGNPILIQTAVKGTNIKITIWGTKDGRNTEIDTPTVLNRRSAGPTKIIKTDTIKPGEKKCIERAHAGADAIFERRVIYSNGELKKDIFKSHYVTWPEVCLVGKRADEVVVASTSTPSAEIPLVIPPQKEDQNSAPQSVSSTEKKTP